MRVPRLRFTVWRLMLVVAGIGLTLGLVRAFPPLLMLVALQATFGPLILAGRLYSRDRLSSALRGAGAGAVSPAGAVAGVAGSMALAFFTCQLSGVMKA